MAQSLFAHISARILRLFVDTAASPRYIVFMGRPTLASKESDMLMNDTSHHYFAVEVVGQMSDEDIHGFTVEAWRERISGWSDFDESGPTHFDIDDILERVSRMVSLYRQRAKLLGCNRPKRRKA